MKISELEKFGKLSESSFKELTTLKVGGKIKYLFEPDSIEKLQDALDYLYQNNIDYKVIGFGSNLLCSDAVYEGVVIKLSQLNKYRIHDDLVYAEAGASMIALANQTIKHSLSGLDFACGIPASVGGCIFMNAGAYKNSIDEVVQRVLVLKTHELVWMDAKELEFNYRQSIFQKYPHWIIIAAEFKLEKGSQVELIAKRNERTRRRLDTQPLGSASCGSIFRNNSRYPAWKVIDSLRLRGFKIGGAKVSSKHTNFIINDNNACAEDVNQIINKIIQDAKAEYNIEMSLEVERFNWPKEKMKQ